MTLEDLFGRRHHGLRTPAFKTSIADLRLGWNVRISVIARSWSGTI